MAHFLCQDSTKARGATTNIERCKDIIRIIVFATFLNMLAVQAPFRHDASALRASFSYLFLEFSKYVSPCKRRFYAVPAPRVHALFVIFYRSASIIPASNPAPKPFFATKP